MRKLAIFALVLGLVIAFAVPAMAFRIEGPKDTKFYFGFTGLLDTGARTLSKERAAGYGSTDDRTEFFMNIPQHSNIHGIIEAGNTGFYWEVRYGRDLQAAHESTVDAPNAAVKTDYKNYIEGAQFYGWYKFGNCQIMAGKSHGHLFTVVPYQNVGQNYGHIYLFGWGAIYDERAAQVRFSQNVNKTFMWQISAVQPYYGDVNVNPNGTYSPVAIPGVTRNVDSYVTFPALALKAAINLGPVSLFPAFGWAEGNFQGLPSGWDDTVTWWIAMLQARATFGPVTILASGNWGQNLGIGGSIYTTAQNPYASPVWSTNGRVMNARSMGGFVDVGFKAGMITPHFFFGYDRAQNTDAYLVGNDYNDRLAAGVSAQIQISPNFNISPEIAYYNYGDTPNNVNKPSMGTEWYYGMQFQFLF
jgi:hypothetical protein